MNQRFRMLCKLTASFASVFDHDDYCNSGRFKRCKSNEPGMIAKPFRQLLLALSWPIMLREAHHLRCASFPGDGDVLIIGLFASPLWIIDDAPEALSNHRKVLWFDLELM